MRQRMKACSSAINYGMGVASLARGLDRHPLIASDLIDGTEHVSAVLGVARRHGRNRLLERRIESVFGWPLRISTSPNKRTLYNFPMQWRRGDAAAGGVAAVRGRHCAGHVDSRRHPA